MADDVSKVAGKQASLWENGVQIARAKIGTDGAVTFGNVTLGRYKLVMPSVDGYTNETLNVMVKSTPETDTCTYTASAATAPTGGYYLWVRGYYDTRVQLKPVLGGEALANGYAEVQVQNYVITDTGFA
jgi:hypothetical protein